MTTIPSSGTKIGPQTTVGSGLSLSADHVLTSAGGDGHIIINPITAGTYTFVDSDNGKLVTFGSACNVTLPDAGSGGEFVSGWSVHIQTLNVAIAITPSTSTINNVSGVLTLIGYQSGWLISNGTHYYFHSDVQGGTGVQSAIIAAVNGSLNATTASGAYAFVAAAAGTFGAQASGNNSFVIGVDGGTASASHSGVIGSYFSVCNGSESVVIASKSTTISGTGSAAISSNAGVATGNASLIMGYSPDDRGRRGSFHIGGGAYDRTWKNFQSGRMTLGLGDLASATTKEFIFDPGTAGGTINMINGSAMTLQMTAIIADEADPVGHNAAFVLMTGSYPGALIARGGNAASTALIGSPVFQKIASAGDGANLSMTLTADTSSGYPKVTATDTTGGRHFYGTLTITFAETIP